MMYFIVGIIVAACIVVFAPLALIWSINILFGLGIAYTFWTWLASLVLATVVSGGIKRG